MMATQQAEVVRFALDESLIKRARDVPIISFIMAHESGNIKRSAGGGYVTDDLLDSLIENPESAVNLFAKLKDEREQMAVLEGYVEIAKPKVRYYDIILQCPGAVLVSVIAKDYGMTAVMFNKLLHELGVQFRFKTNRTWLLYKEYDNKGYTITKTYCKGKYSYIHMCWTQKGRRFLYDFLRSHGIFPQVELMQSGFITAGG